MDENEALEQNEADEQFQQWDPIEDFLTNL